MKKVMLTTDVKGLGRKDAIVDVSDGYARNYLLPRGMAVEATAARMNEAKKKEDAGKSRDIKEAARAGDLAGILSELHVVIRSRVGENGRLFGSVTGADIAEALQADHGIGIDKKKIILAEPIRHICDTRVEIRLGHGVHCTLAVRVEGEATDRE